MMFQTSVPNTWLQARVSLALRPIVKEPAPKPLGDRECDCGRFKRGQAKACWYCNYLDGERRQERLIISALRLADEPLGLGPLADQIGSTRRSVLRSLNAMRAIGRVDRVWGDPRRPRTTFGWQKPDDAGTVLVGNGRWLYFLVVRPLR